jgi:hypothetical protein
MYNRPIAVTVLSKARTIFTFSDNGVVGSSPTQGMDVCGRLFSVCAILYVGSGLAIGWFPVPEVLLTVCRIKKLKKQPGTTRAVEPEISNI